MTEQALQDSWWLFTRARGTGLVLRLSVFVAPVAALAVTRVAAPSTPAVVELAVVLLTLGCVVSPDSHVGMLVALLVALDWLVAVKDVTSPWSLGVAIALLVFHAAMSAASIAAPAAVWSPAMLRRWLRRAAKLAVACVVVWLLVIAVNARNLGASGAIVAAALVVLAVGGLWAADVTVDRRASRREGDPPR